MVTILLFAPKVGRKKRFFFQIIKNNDLKNCLIVLGKTFHEKKVFKSCIIKEILKEYL